MSLVKSLPAVVAIMLLYASAGPVFAMDQDTDRKVRVVRDTETIQSKYEIKEAGIGRNPEHGEHYSAPLPRLFHCYFLETKAGESWEIVTSEVEGDGTIVATGLYRIDGSDCVKSTRIERDVHRKFKGLWTKKHNLKFTSGGGAYWVITTGNGGEEYSVSFKRNASSSSPAIEEGASGVPAPLAPIYNGGPFPGPIVRERLDVITERVFARLSQPGTTWVGVDGGKFTGIKFIRSGDGTLAFSGNGLRRADFRADPSSESYIATLGGYETVLFAENEDTLQAVVSRVDEKGRRDWVAHTSFALLDDGRLKRELHSRFGPKLFSVGGETTASFFTEVPDSRVAELEIQHKQEEARRQAAIERERAARAREELDRDMATIRRQNALAGILDGANAIMSEQAARSSAELENTLALAREQARRQQEEERQRQLEQEARQRQQQVVRHQQAADGIAQRQRLAAQQQQTAKEEAERQARARAEQQARQRAEQQRIAAEKAAAERQRKAEADRLQALRREEQDLRAGFSGYAATCVGGGKDVLYLQASRPSRTGCDVGFEARCPGTPAGSGVRFGQDNYVGGSCMGIGDSIRIGNMDCAADQVRISMTRADCGSGG